MTEVNVQQSGAELIAAERRRQVESEGWSKEHDAGHRSGHLARAAACYATPPGQRRYLKALGFGATSDVYEPAPLGWPWASQYWKPSDDRVRELVKAGALIAAEIDRLTA